MVANIILQITPHGSRFYSIPLVDGRALSVHIDSHGQLVSVNAQSSMYSLMPEWETLVYEPLELLLDPDELNEQTVAILRDSDSDAGF